MAKNKSSRLSSVCHSAPPLFTATSGGGFWLGKAVPCLSLSLLAFLSHGVHGFPLSLKLTAHSHSRFW
uniref:Uncharacterized protein n=1 Tax=Fagus sylvatica TaxID=28930 RepID=A0A2N9EMG4_FAGSY